MSKESLRDELESLLSTPTETHNIVRLPNPETVNKFMNLIESRERELARQIRDLFGDFSSKKEIFNEIDTIISERWGDKLNFKKIEPPTNQE